MSVPYWLIAVLLVLVVLGLWWAIDMGKRGVRVGFGRYGCGCAERRDTIPLGPL